MSGKVRCFNKILPLLLYLSAPLLAQAPLAQIDSHINESLAQYEVPGLSIAVVKDDKIVLAKGYGLIELDKPQPIDENTIFAIAPNSKIFTATAMGLLDHEEKLTWDDPVIDHLPDFQMYDPVVTRKITIRDLLCHNCGLATYGGDLTWFGANYSRDEVYRRIRFQKPTYEFRTGYGYCNLMFLVAGRIIPTVTGGTTWDEFIKERFFIPLNMTRSNTTVTELKNVDNVAIPHTRDKGKVVKIPYLFNADTCGPAGAINSTAHDMAQWLKLQLAKGSYNGKQIVSESVIEETRKSHNLRSASTLASVQKTLPAVHFMTYGLGLGLRDYHGRIVYSHGGELPGMFSYVVIVPEEDLAVVVLSNLDGHSLSSALAFYVIDSYIGQDAQATSDRFFKVYKEDLAKEEKKEADLLASRIENTKPSHPLADYTGSYTNSLYGPAEIIKKKDAIELHLSAHPDIIGRLSHFQYDTFLCTFSDFTWGKSLLHFELNDKGKVKQFKIAVRPDWIDTLTYTFTKK